MARRLFVGLGRWMSQRLRRAAPPSYREAVVSLPKKPRPESDQGSDDATSAAESVPSQASLLRPRSAVPEPVPPDQVFVFELADTDTPVRQPPPNPVHIEPVIKDRADMASLMATPDHRPRAERPMTPPREGEHVSRMPDVIGKESRPERDAESGYCAPVPRIDLEPPTDGTDSGRPTIFDGAQLLVASSAGAQVRAWGIGRWFPASSINAKGCDTIMVGPNCRYRAEEHYHVQQLTISTDGIDKIKTHLADLVSGKLSVHDFQTAMKSWTTSRAASRQNQVTQPTSSSVRVSIDGAEDVSVGSTNAMRSTLHCVIHETTLPLIDLLADNRDLVESFKAMLSKEPPAGATSDFLRDLAAAGHALDVKTLLGHSSTPEGLSDAFIGSLFGHTSVKGASVVMLGDNLKYDRTTDVNLPGMRFGRLLRGLKVYAKDITPPTSRTTPTKQPGSEVYLSGRRYPGKMKPAFDGDGIDDIFDGDDIPFLNGKSIDDDDDVPPPTFGLSM